MVDFNVLFSQTMPYTTITVLQVLTALIILVIGWVITRIIMSVFKGRMEKTNLPELR
ncbi:MAG: hypothetical protein SVM80_11205 [Halobacteriota archaeon]|nr:hypothetical protein [Halobacteriota archaeon]